MKNRKNYTGCKFNHWTIIKDGEDYVSSKNKKHRRRVWVKCDCGNEKEYLVVLQYVINGMSQGCCKCSGKRKGQKAKDNRSHNKPFNYYEIKDDVVFVYSSKYPELYTTIDLKWLDYFKQYHLFPRKDRNNGYYWLIKKDGKDVKIHQIIKGKHADHIDGNKSNNLESNLREATSSQNAANRGKNKNNKTGYKGVSIKQGKPFAQIRCNNKIYRLGYFESLEEAAKTYDRKAIELFGDFAWTNFPKEIYLFKEE